jgi:hypothetical protein
MLELPITIRVPLPGEMEHRADIDELLARRKKANILQGYKLTDRVSPKMPYTFQAEININNSILWNLVLSLSELLPEDICCSYGVDGEEVITTAYLSKTEILQKLTPYKEELVKDCALEFSLFAHTPEGLTEIIITSFKYIRYSGKNKTTFFDCMQQFQLKEVTDLAFVDEYPKIIEPLKTFLPQSRRPEDVIWSLNRSFGIEV